MRVIPLCINVTIEFCDGFLGLSRNDNAVPTGFHPSAQGCAARATLGQRPKHFLNPEGGRALQSARGLAHSKTLRVIGGHSHSRQRLGVRRPSAAFTEASINREPREIREQLFENPFAYLAYFAVSLIPIPHPANGPGHRIQVPAGFYPVLAKSGAFAVVFTIFLPRTASVRSRVVSVRARIAIIRPRITPILHRIASVLPRTTSVRRRIALVRARINPVPPRTVPVRPRVA
ncbi:MAG: hypothetical protein RL616_1640 [Verrucomicrobiota bacterium]